MARKKRSDAGKKRGEYVHTAEFLAKQKNKGKIVPKKEEKKSKAKAKTMLKKEGKKAELETPKTEPAADVSTL